MEDYTYHFEPGNEMVLGSHMLEICPSITEKNISCEIHPLGIGGKEDPVRLVFNAKAGTALNVSLVDMGHRFRLILHKVEGEFGEMLGIETLVIDENTTFDSFKKDIMLNEIYYRP